MIIKMLSKLLRGVIGKGLYYNSQHAWGKVHSQSNLEIKRASLLHDQQQPGPQSSGACSIRPIESNWVTRWAKRPYGKGF